jgi:F-type H+-transporting ATPase subunit delta
MTSVRQAAQDASRLFRLSIVNGLPDVGRVRRIVNDLLASGRRGRFTVAAQFLRRLKRDSTERMAEVDSAAPLDAQTRATIEANLARRYARAIATTFVVDATLIGGIRIAAASDVYDDSIRARLSALETAA